MRRRNFIAGLASAAAWPVSARAQKATVPVIGYLSGGSEIGSRHLTAAFRRGLSEFGFIEGRNAEILYRWAETQYDRLPVLAADLVNRKVNLIAATAGPAPALAAKSASDSIPIVFTSGSDPVALGLVGSLGRPGGNVTGVAILAQTVVPKLFELLHEAAPAAMTIGFLVYPPSPTTNAEISEAETAAHMLGVRLVVLKASTPTETESAFSNFVEQRGGALVTATDRIFFENRAQITALAARYALPAIYGSREYTEASGLMSYGPNLTDAYRLAGVYAGRILKGEKAADLPVQQSTKVEFVINLKTAKALGLTIPVKLLGRADEVIE